MKEVIEHYNKLIDENNDPARDPKPLREYMDKWDGQRFIESMQLDKSKSVLEIGIGTGRIAVKVAPNCKSLCGIDISEKTIQRAAENLSMYQNIKLICDDFMSCKLEADFDVIYSSLTFMHIQDKLSAIQKVAALLSNNGLFVLSIDKNQNEYIDMGDRKVKIYPDNPNDIRSYLSASKLKLIDEFETDHAYVTVSRKASLSVFICFANREVARGSATEGL
ncbi:MAG: class I SAM-dependent methyltransferase [Clostridia bacterium]|nr:class I SAM-dependent methyltransferase [Clostridia bacterium]